MKGLLAENNTQYLGDAHIVLEISALNDPVQKHPRVMISNDAVQCRVYYVCGSSQCCIDIKYD